MFVAPVALYVCVIKFIELLTPRKAGKKKKKDQSRKIGKRIKTSPVRLAKKKDQSRKIGKKNKDQPRKAGKKEKQRLENS